MVSGGILWLAWVHYADLLWFSHLHAVLRWWLLVCNKLLVSIALSCHSVLGAALDFCKVMVATFLPMACRSWVSNYLTRLVPLLQTFGANRWDTA